MLNVKPLLLLSTWFNVCIRVREYHHLWARFGKQPSSACSLECLILGFFSRSTSNTLQKVHWIPNLTSLSFMLTNQVASFTKPANSSTLWTTLAVIGWHWGPIHLLYSVWSWSGKKFPISHHSNVQLCLLCTVMFNYEGWYNQK